MNDPEHIRTKNTSDEMPWWGPFAVIGFVNLATLLLVLLIHGVLRLLGR